MKTFAAFYKKEWLEMVRTGKLAILLVLFGIFGIMNPAISKITPWMMKFMSESLKEAGLIVTDKVTADAITSWVQFYKNIPMALIVFVLLLSASFTLEYQKGTLILVLTKGLSRWKVLLAKTLNIFCLWTICYWECFAITYIYNEFFWKNKGVSHIFSSAGVYYLFGIWVLSVMIFLSAVLKNNTGVLIGVGATVGGVYLIGLFKEMKTYLPVKLMDATELLFHHAKLSGYGWSVGITMGLVLLAVAGAVFGFNRRRV